MDYCNARGGGKIMNANTDYACHGKTRVAIYPGKQQKHYFSTKLHVAGLREIFAKHSADGGTTENSYNAFRLRIQY